MKFSQSAIAISIILGMLGSCTFPTEPGQDENDRPVNQIVADIIHAVIEPDSTIWTWGPNFSGTLGNGTMEDSDVPVQVLNIKNAVAIDLFIGIAVAADQEGNIWFWGNYWTYLELPGLDTVITAPVKISYLKGVKSIHVFDLDVHLLKEDGTVWYIKLDNNHPTKFIEPEKVSQVDNIIRLSEYLVLKNNGSIYYLIDSPPERGGYVSAINVKEIARVYQRRTVILKKDGTVWAWGLNDFGQLGNGSYRNSTVPVRVSNLTGIVAISANYDFNLALKKDGTVWYWGLVRPDGTESIRQNIPVKIENLNDVSLIYADYKSIVRENDGTYWLFNCEERIPEQVQF